MGNASIEKVVQLPLEQLDSQSSSATLDGSDSQTLESIFVSGSSNAEPASRPSYFNPIRPGGPCLPRRLPEVSRLTLPAHPNIKDYHEENQAFSHFSLGENILNSNNIPMQDDFQASTPSNYHRRQLPTEDEELIPEQVGLRMDYNASRAESSNYVATHSVSNQRSGTKSPVNIARVTATQRALIERKLRGAKQAKSTQLQVDISPSIENTKEDDSWMNEAPPVDEEYNDLIERIDTLQQRQHNGKITRAETITLSKLERELLLKKKLEKAAANAAKQSDEEQSLFVPEETREEAAQRHIKSAPPTGINTEGDDRDMTEDIGSESWCGKVIREGEVAPESKTKKPRRKAVKNAREFHERERQDRQTKERQKAQKKKSRKATKTTSSNAIANKGKAQRKSKGAIKANKDLEEHFKFRGQDGVDTLTQRFLQDLKCSDQITDRINDPFFKTAPEEAIFEKNKDTQLQKLLLNIPHGSSKKAATSDKVKLLKASRSFGYAKVHAENGKWRVKGMKSTLYHHQLLGAQWMLARELGQSPFGGLLADVMGLGKTVQMLACMVGNRPQPDDFKRKRTATLIVAPSSVINQWMDEIRVHVESSVFPKIYHYTSRSMVPPEVLEDLDIVVASYTEVMRQLPVPDCKTEKRGYLNWLKENPDQMGDLHKVSWYRVVLDEAHAIKNNKGRTSIACQSLKSLYRWCLTGTPLLNRLEEMFPYLRFLEADYDIDWETFQQKICNPQAEESYARIIALLSHTMLRRTMKTSILNRPIITLPEPHPDIQYVNFSPQERIIYRITENRFRSNISRFFEQGTAAANYRHIFVQLLRLRQCTSHPFMMEQTIKEFWTPEDVQNLKHSLSQFSGVSTPFYEQCEAWVKNSEKERHAAKESTESSANNLTPESMAFGASDFGHSFKMDKELARLGEEENFTRVVCGICGDLPQEPTKTDCDDIFCRECLLKYMHTSMAADDFECHVCPNCDRIFTEVNPCGGNQFHDDYNGESDTSEDEMSDGQLPRRSRKKKNKDGPGTDAMGFEPKTKRSAWLAMSDKDHTSTILPSVKLTVLKTILLKGFEEAPMDKVVIYVQFRLSARIIGRICKKEGWKFVYLTGDTSLDHRHKAIKMFRDRDDVKILIAGLKCGGLGLNFPWANRCISLDLWWNHAVEQQAFGRIFRIGQKKETYMTRIVVRNTIDMRLLSMQLYKMSNCENAISENAQKRPTLGIADLARLFGFLKTDKDDNIIEIQPDYDDEDGILQHEDDPMPGQPMGDSGAQVTGDWSFGNDETRPEDESPHSAYPVSDDLGVGAREEDPGTLFAAQGPGNETTPMEID